MLQSKLFPKTVKQAPKEAVSPSHKYLTQGGFIDMLMAGVYTYLPLGWRVIDKICNIVRQEMDAVGGQELLMPALQPKNIWQETGRWDSLKGVMYQFQNGSKKDVGLAATHEEVIYDLIRRNVKSYKELPFAVYQIQNKFRDELRAKGGLMRGREFMMKDMYSFHISEDDCDKYYLKVIEAYKNTYKRCGLEVKVVEASGGIFTDKYSHEFQVISDIGEDKILYCSKCDYGQNSEIGKLNKNDQCPECGAELKEGKSIEVGNIFKFGDKYAKDMNGYVSDKNGAKQAIYMASYGIGISRLVGAIAELYNDDRGLTWPESVAPYQIHLISLNKNSEADKIYQQLNKAGAEVLYDDREVSAGEKFADADLIGLPYRVVISDKTEGKVAVKERKNKDEKIVTVDDLIKY